jgi:hypothetical protein
MVAHEITKTSTGLGHEGARLGVQVATDERVREFPLSRDDLETVALEGGAAGAAGAELLALEREALIVPTRSSTF